MLGKTDSYTYKSLKDYNKDIYDLIKYTPIYKRIEDASPKVNPTRYFPIFVSLIVWEVLIPKKYWKIMLWIKKYKYIINYILKPWI